LSQTAPSPPPASLLGVVGKAAIRVLQNPIKSLTFLGLLFLVIALVYDILTPAVFIEDVAIAPSLSNRGFTGSSLLSSAIDELHPAVLRRAQALRARDRKLLDLIDQPFKGYETAHECTSTISLLPYNDTVFESSLQRVLMSSSALDTTIVTSKEFFSIRPLAFYIREMLNWKPLRLTPFLYQDEDHFVIKITPSPTADLTQIRVFDRLEDADHVFSELLVSYFAPHLTALEALYRGEEPLPFWQIAKEFLQDQQKSLTYFADGSRSPSDKSCT
jgi:hypothetical protein